MKLREIAERIRFNEGDVVEIQCSTNCDDEDKHTMDNDVCRDGDLGVDGDEWHGDGDREMNLHVILFVGLLVSD